MGKNRDKSQRYKCLNCGISETRKRKDIEKINKKKMQESGKVKLNKEVFLAVLKKNV